MQGDPGPVLGSLALALCAQLGRAVEYVCVTRDTQEGDLKQRREIRNGQVNIQRCKRLRILTLKVRATENGS